MQSENPKEKYVQYAIDWGFAIVKGDHKTANRIHRNLVKTIGQLKKDSADCRSYLTGLIDHPEPSVRLIASIDSLYLGFDLTESELALNNLISNPNIGVLSLMAFASLDNWRKKVGK